MERGVVVRGRLHGRQIDLDEDVGALEGDVEVTVRPASAPRGTVGGLLALVATFPAGSRTEEEIDRQIAEDRASGGT